MKRRVPRIVRQQIAERAGYRCEYCRVREEDSFLPFEIDHIVSLKHGGGNEDGNLAFACPHCNQYKGTDLVTYLET
jgi:5-methylcytosine-specific restriction endonuclease McrA